MAKGGSRGADQPRAGALLIARPDCGVASDAIARWAGGLGAVVRRLPSYHD